jgi:hypothetical protein
MDLQFGAICEPDVDRGTTASSPAVNSRTRALEPDQIGGIDNQPPSMCLQSIMCDA